MADRNQHLSRDDETRRAVFDQVDLQTAELEIVGSIYDGFAAAIVVTGQPRTVALTREYGDAVQLMALIERGRAPLFAIDLAGGDAFQDFRQACECWAVRPPNTRRLCGCGRCPSGGAGSSPPSPRGSAVGGSAD